MVEDGVLAAVGGTKLVRLRSVVPPDGAPVLVKLESGNPTGSMKDRMAVAVVRAALERGAVRPGETVVEYTAGTTGVSLAFVCATLGLDLHVVFSDAFSEEKRRTMRAFGARITDVASDGGRITETLIKAMIERARALSAEPGHWWSDQLNNHDAIGGYHALGDEIWEQTGGRVDVLVQSVGTAHAIHGTAESLRRHGWRGTTVAVEPAESAVLSGGSTGSHRIEGIGIGFVPPLWRPDEVDRIETVPTDDAMTMARRLAREEGIFAGTSTGANVVAACRMSEELGEAGSVVTIAVDSGLRYLSTPLYAPPS